MFWIKAVVDPFWASPCASVDEGQAAADRTDWYNPASAEFPGLVCTGVGKGRIPSEEML